MLDFPTLEQARAVHDEERSARSASLLRAVAAQSAAEGAIGAEALADILDGLAGWEEVFDQGPALARASATAAECGRAVPADVAEAVRADLDRVAGERKASPDWYLTPDAVAAEPEGNRPDLHTAVAYCAFDSKPSFLWDGVWVSGLALSPGIREALKAAVVGNAAWSAALEAHSAACDEANAISFELGDYAYEVADRLGARGPGL